MDEITKNIFIALGVWIVVALPTVLILNNYFRSRTGFLNKELLDGN